MTKKIKGGEIEMDVKVDTQQLEDAKDLVGEVRDRINSVVPNITIRNNENVYVTINNFNTTADEYYDDEEDDEEDNKEIDEIPVGW